MTPLLFALPGGEARFAPLCALLDAEVGQLDLHQFPDGEWCPRLLTPVAGRHVIFACALDRPDAVLLPLYLSACVARELGAASVGLLIPYLPYMRQDARFHAGEGITSAHFARLLASCCDWLVTIDPHLHRHPTLRTIYPIAAEAVTAAPALADWIAANVERPLIVGPDEESEQWVAQVARLLGCPHTVLRKVRHGDAEVDVSIPDVQQWRRCTPILLDDIISTAQTMIAAARNLAALGLPAPVCVGVHALFARGAYDALLAAGVARVVTGNSVAHPSNAIDLLPVLAEPVRGLIAAQSRG